jgi:hypothetical protein
MTIDQATASAGLTAPISKGAVPASTPADKSSIDLPKQPVKPAEPEKPTTPIWTGGLSYARRVLDSKDPYMTKKGIKALKEHLAFFRAQREDIDQAIEGYQKLLTDAERVDVPMNDRADSEQEPFGSSER